MILSSSIIIMPPTPRISDLNAHFTVTVASGQKKTPTVTCKHCGYTKSRNASRQTDHLLYDCQQYKNFMEGKTSKVSGSTRSIRPFALPLAADKIDRLDQLAANAVFAGGRPLSLFECPYMKKLLHELNPKWKPPTAYQLKEKLLPEAYDQLKDQVMDEILEPSSTWNVIFDASDDVASRRTLNISLATPNGVAVYLGNIDTSDEQHTAENTAEQVASYLEPTLSKKKERVNSFVSDTCAAARASIRVLTAKPEFSHAFQVGCDAHGLNLLFKDITKISPLSGLFTHATKVLDYFRNSGLQYSRLRREQKQIYNQEHSVLGA